DTTVCVSIFDSLALAFHSKLDVYGREPSWFRVPCVLAGKLYLNGTSATPFTCYYPRRLPSGDTDQSGSSSKVVHTQKIEPMTVSELNQFIFTADPQVTEIQLDEGCVTLAAPLAPRNSYERRLHSHASHAMKPMLWLNSNDTGAAAFLGFDEEVASLTHVLASDAAQIVGIGTNAQVDIDLPRSLANLVGSTYTFQLRLKDFNFGPNHRSFTISRIFPARGWRGYRSISPPICGNMIKCQSWYPHEAVASGEDAGEATARKKARVE
ncbi:hypothetical protein HID58_092362, partial [Brassica napus]